MNKKLILASTAALLALPLVSLADYGTSPEVGELTGLNIADLVDLVFSFIWPIIVAVVIISFILSAFLFITAQGDPGKIAQGRQAVIWGIAGIVVLFIAYSILAILRGQLGIA